MLKSSDPVSCLLSLFTDAEFHRALVINEEVFDVHPDGKVTSDSEGPSDGGSIEMITQTDLLKYLWKLLNVVTKMPAQDVSKLAWKRVNESQENLVITCPSNASTLAAFRLMFIHRKNAVAVVDKDGRLIANLSCSDLRGLHRGNLDTLLLPVYEFLEISSKDREGGLLPDQLRNATPDTPLDVVVNMMLESHIHRVWLTNDNDEPVGVVSITDVLSLFAPDETMD